MTRGKSNPAPEQPSDVSETMSLASPVSVTRLLRFGCVAMAGLFLANCAGNQVANRGRSKEIGAFPQSKYGPASPRVVAEGQEVPKGGGRQLIGNSYSVAGKRYTPYQKPMGYTVVGNASWYGEAFHGRRTANGEVYDRHGISAAHPTMPLPAYARVSNMLNQSSIIVRVNDRGPYHGNRVMDVSQKTADALAFRHLGTARVKVEYLGQASLAGSDDKLLLATLRTDGSPAAIPGTSAPTMVASSAPVPTGRTASVDLDDERIESPRQQPAPQPVAQAYAEPVRTIAPANPVAASMISTASMSSTASMPLGTPVKAAPMPPSRPFDLDTIAGAASPVRMRTIGPVPLPPVRTNVASLFAAPERSPAQRFSNSHPLARDLAPQTLQSLARN